MNFKFSNKQIKSALGKKTQDAQRLLQDRHATGETLKKAKKLLEKVKKMPVIGGLVEDVMTTIALIGDYVNGSYRKVPFGVIISAMAAMIYFISPIDLIPDTIPLAGYIDDAAVITFVLGGGLGTELKKYRKWNFTKEKELICKGIKEQLITAVGSDHLVAVFMTEDDKLKLLLAEATAMEERPIEVRPIVLEMPYDALRAVCTQLNMAVADAVNDATVDLRENILSGKQVDVCYESDFKDFDALFEILIEEEVY